MTQPLVLIIDDNAEELRSYQATFEAAGFIVHFGETYEGIRELYGDIVYDLVLCDYHSKGARPHTVLKMMKQRGVQPKEFWIHTGDPSAFAVDGMAGVLEKGDYGRLFSLTKKSAMSRLVSTDKKLCA